jgi:hypothetical protein
MKLYSVVMAVIFIAASQTSVAQPVPEISEYIKTLGGGAVTYMKENPGKLYVGLNFEWVKRPPPGAYLVVQFTNSIVDNPVVVEQPADVSTPTFVLKSPAYDCASNNSVYTMKVSIFSDGSKSKLLGVHSQEIEFSVPAKHWGALKLKECHVHSADQRR